MSSSLGGSLCLSSTTARPCSSKSQSRSPLVSNNASSSSYTMRIFGRHTRLGTFTGVDPSGCFPPFAILSSASDPADAVNVRFSEYLEVVSRLLSRMLSSVLSVCFDLVVLFFVAFVGISFCVLFFFCVIVCFCIADP